MPHLHFISPRRSAAAFVLPAVATLAALAPSAQAQTAQIATATSSPTAGMSYTATDADNTIGVKLSGDRFTIDDVVPIKAGSGCTPVSGDVTKVTCDAPKEQFGRFKRFTVFGGLGRDTVVNQTTIGAVRGAPMLVFGNGGLDQLFGANLVSDELRGGSDGDLLRGGDLGDANTDDVLLGGSGNDALQGGKGNDRLEGGSGIDNLDGGEGTDRLDGGRDADRIDGGLNDPNFQRDMVLYIDRSNPVRVDLRNEVATGQGEQGENDTITRVENIQGGRGNDSLTGNAGANLILGNQGDDGLGGEEGPDVLDGGEGSDILVPSPGAPPFGARAGRPGRHHELRARRRLAGPGRGTPGRRRR